MSEAKPCCDGIEVINERLEAYNAILVTNLFGPPRMILSTCKRRGHVRSKKPPLVFASYCPFCGKKYPDSK